MINAQLHILLLGEKKFSYTCPWTLSVPQRTDFSQTWLSDNCWSLQTYVRYGPLKFVMFVLLWRYRRHLITRWGVYPMENNSDFFYLSVSTGPMIGLLNRLYLALWPALFEPSGMINILLTLFPQSVLLVWEHHFST